MSDENKKETEKIIDNLATTIVDNIQSITDNCIKKAKYDKSFNTVVLGVNQNFSDKVPEDKQKELIEKFKIPDEYSSPAYYTFMINGEYYVKASKNEYYLYDEICVRVPNGSWDNMYIEINLPRDKESGCIGEWSDKGKNSAVIINTDKPNTIEGDNGFCAGRGNIIQSDNCFCLGVDNTIKRYALNNICMGHNNYINNGSELDDIQGHDGCIIGGKNNQLFGSGDFIGGGLSNKTSKSCSTVMGGCGNNVSADYGYIGGGYRNIIKESPYSSITGGHDNEIDYWTSYGILAHKYNHIGSGYANKIKASDYSAIIGGKSNRLSFTESTIVLGGAGLTNQKLLSSLNLDYFSRHLVMCGSYNKNFANTQQLFEVGNGTSDKSRSNAFRVTSDGNIYAGAAVNSTGADFAEMREWSDGNPNNEDRRGLFVVYDDSIDYKIGEYAKIRIANENDDLDNVLGIVSSNPTVVGNTASETWQGMWQRDIFGNVITEEKHFPAETKETENPETGEKETVVVIPEHTEIVPVVNPIYDGTKEYKGRKDRPEWGVVGMLGMVVTVDDGSCKMLEYCKVGNNGIATHSDVKTRFRVVARLDGTHIAVEIKP